eukprot:5094991-Amphidinium_carterae.3
MLSSASQRVSSCKATAASSLCLLSAAIAVTACRLQELRSLLVDHARNNCYVNCPKRVLPRQVLVVSFQTFRTACQPEYMETEMSPDCMKSSLQVEPNHKTEVFK